MGLRVGVERSGFMVRVKGLTCALACAPDVINFAWRLIYGASKYQIWAIVRVPRV